MEIRLFGPVEVTASGTVLDVGPPQRATVLAALAVDAGRLVPIETLIARVWGDTAPERALRALHAHIARIRRVLGEGDPGTDGSATLRRRTGGYLLDIDPDRVDLHRFRRLVDNAREPGRPDADGARLLGQALALWRGEPLTGLGGEWAASTRHGWRRQREDAVLAWAHAKLRTGDPVPVIDPMAALIGENPFHEGAIAALMLALSASGRGTEALGLYTTTRTRLVEELGTEPGAELRRVHQAILRGDRDHEDPGPAPVGATPPAGPAQLPHDARGFVGRGAELARLDAILAAAGRRSGPAVVAALVGTPGVGKTSLAVHWAHRVRDRFPDGQLYLNLRGFDADGSAVEPTAAVRRFLDALHVPAHRIPADPDDQAALYRGELSRRRVLIVLDNARDTAQVRPLLPGAPGCLVLVTSRNQLIGLGAAEGAYPITVDLLTADEARELLAGRLDHARVAAEPQAVREIVTRCARLPLALAIVAARAAAHPHLSLSGLAGELGDARHRLDLLRTDDPATDVRAAFSWSYQALSPAAATLFRLFSRFPGTELSTAVAASLAALPFPRVRALLAELAGANLVVERSTGRYTIHDLLRDYAADLSRGTDDAGQRHEATGRVLDHYLHTAYAAALLLEPTRYPIVLSRPRAGVTPEHLTDHDRAMAWFATEYATLLDAIDETIRAGLDGYTWQLAWTLTDYLHRRGHWPESVAVGRAALAAAGRLADPVPQSSAHIDLAITYLVINRDAEADPLLRRALELSTRAGDLIGQARAFNALGFAADHRGDHAQALRYAQQGLDRYRAAGYLPKTARSLSNVAWAHAQLGDHEQALVLGDQAIAVCREGDDRQTLAHTWDTLGYAYHHLGRLDQARSCYHHAIDGFRELGLRYHEATAFTYLGDTHHTGGDTRAARIAWQRALTIFAELDHPDADKVRTKLSGSLVPVHP